MKRVMIVVLMLLMSMVMFAQTDPLIQQIINQVSQDSLMTTVSDISGTGTNRTVLTSGHNVAKSYLQQKFVRYGLTPTMQVVNANCTNILYTQTGTKYPKRKLIIGAHYDSATNSPGADDNGTGTAIVVEAARIFSMYNTQYTIVFALWDWEESGTVGSGYYATNAYNTKDTIVGYINVDMIGYDSNNDGKMEIHARPSAKFIADSLMKINTSYGIGLSPTVYNPGLTNSDHGSFWEWNLVALWLIEQYQGNDFNPYYHSSSDVIGHINASYFSKNAKMTIGALASLAKMTEKALPITLSSFNATITSSNAVVLEWKTLYELSNYGFEVQRANVGLTSFSTISPLIPGVGTGEGKSYSFTDTTPGKTSSYRLKQYDLDGTFHYSDVISVNVVYANPNKNCKTTDVSLEQNYPNPFNPSTTIPFSLGKPERVTVTVYTMLGERIVTLIDNRILPQGKHSVKWDSTHYPSGTYLYVLRTPTFVYSKRLVILR